MVFFRFNDNMLLLNLFDNLGSSMFTVATSEFKSECEYNTFVSSVNNLYCKFGETLQISLTYIKNNSGPNMEHCGAPHFIDDVRYK